MSVGANIKNRRFELRMSQQDLAEAMGYKTRSTIAKIESGENDVSQKKLQKFATVLDTTVESLISGYPAYPVDKVVEQHPKDYETKNVVIILAGGKTIKNRQSIPSQFISVKGKPVLVYCMEAYQSHPSIDDIYVVCLKSWESIVEAYSKQYGVTKLRGLIPAGNSGILSLKNALDHIRSRYLPSDRIIIQESTRPMVTTETISQLLQVCSKRGSATIGHSMNEYVQFTIDKQRPRYIDRNTVIALQSPEAHSLALLTEVFEKAQKQHHALTESCCTMLLYNLGYNINFVESNINNIKITREEDLSAFSALIRY